MPVAWPSYVAFDTFSRITSYYAVVQAYSYLLFITNYSNMCFERVSQFFRVTVSNVHVVA